MNNYILKQAVFVVVTCLIYSCNISTNKKYLKRTVTDMAGRSMIVPDTIKRVYVNKPGSLVLYAIAPDMLVSRTLWLNNVAKPYMDPSYIALPYVNGSAEEIVKLKPDIIINCFSINPESKNEADRLSEQTGIPVFQITIDMNNYTKTFNSLGNLLHKECQAEKMNDFVHHYLDTIASRVKLFPENKKVKVYYAEGEDGRATDPSGSFHSQIIDFVGATNVAKVNIMGGKGLSKASMEQILLWDPDVILCWTGWGNTLTTYQCILQDKIWQSMRALKNHAIYQIPYTPYGWFDRPPGTNRIIGTVWTANLLYPEIFPYDMNAVTKEYFKIFYHKDLTDIELKNVLSTAPEGLLISKGQKKLDKVKNRYNKK